MRSLIHKKRQNIGIIFELLTKQLTTSSVNNDKNKQSAILSLIRKYFSKGTILHEELQLFNTILYNQASKWQTASRLLQEVQNAYGKLNHEKLKNEKYKLLNEILKTLVVNIDKCHKCGYNKFKEDEKGNGFCKKCGAQVSKSPYKNESLKKFFAQEIPQYKVYASLYSLMENNIKNECYDISQKVKLEEVVINHLLDNKEIHRINEFAQQSDSPNEYRWDSLGNESQTKILQTIYGSSGSFEQFVNKEWKKLPSIVQSKIKLYFQKQITESLDDLTYAFVIKKFNQRYNKILSESQKEILKYYIESTSDKVFEVFVNKKVKNIENDLYEEIKKVKDKNILQKLYESMLKFGNINSFNKEKKTECLLTYSQLLEELKKNEN